MHYVGRTEQILLPSKGHGRIREPLRERRRRPRAAHSHCVTVFMDDSHCVIYNICMNSSDAARRPGKRRSELRAALYNRPLIRVYVCTRKIYNYVYLVVAGSRHMSAN